jgi:DNA-binding transcriptional ArsR family regulator
MLNYVSGPELRERLRARLEATRVETVGDLLQVLAVRGNQELLSLIGRHNPKSISALSELAGRRQPNVSRSLSALIGSELVEIVSNGRSSTPILTALGRQKAMEHGLLDGDWEEDGREQTSTPEPTLFEVEEVSGDINNDSSSERRLLVLLRLRGATRVRATSLQGDPDAAALHIAENWWRMLYRTDAPFKLFDLCYEAEKSFTLSVKSWGRHVELVTRPHAGGPMVLDDGFRRMAPERFEASLLEELLRPLARLQRLNGNAAEPLQDRLSRLEDSRASPVEASFCKTAGALGLSPYGLGDDIHEDVLRLIALISDEESRLDFASAVLADELQVGQSWTLAEVGEKGPKNQLPLLLELRSRCRSVWERPTYRAMRPWEIGTDLARAVREELKLAPDVRITGVPALARLFGAEKGVQLSRNPPGSLRAFQTYWGDYPTVVVENEGRHTSFLLARAAGDFLANGSRAACIADIYTDRQAVGRAFAAELLAPAEGVISMVEEDQSFERIAQHYQVSREVVSNQYENNSWR